MVTCPLCEHQQEFGLECEQCGKDLGTLAALGPPPTRAEPIDGLETRELVGEVVIESLVDLEGTPYAPVEVSPEVTPELERTALSSVGEVPVEPMVDLSVDRAIDTEPRVTLPQGDVTCRYCRHVQPPRLLCERCGMSLPRRAGVEVLPVAARSPDETTRCRACGAPAKVGQRCGDCGHLVEPP